MDLTDKAYAIFAAVLLILSLGFLAEQEISLRGKLSTANTSLDAEIQCRVGSTCAQKASSEAARGQQLVADALTKAASDAKAAQDARDQQSANAVRNQQAAAAQAQKDALTWKQKYTQALQSPDCGTWAKQAVVCAVQ